jgi:hypothetical protein
MIKPSKKILEEFFSSMDKLPDPENIQEVTRMVTDWCCREYRTDPYWLNNGWCYYWALLVWSLTSEKLNVKFRNIGYYKHVVVELDGTFYDSCHQKGTIFESDFSPFGYFDKEPKNTAEMCQFWLHNGKYPDGFACVINELYADVISR